MTDNALMASVRAVVLRGQGQCITPLKFWQARLRAERIFGFNPGTDAFLGDKIGLPKSFQTSRPWRLKIPDGVFHKWYERFGVSPHLIMGREHNFLDPRGQLHVISVSGIKDFLQRYLFLPARFDDARTLRFYTVRT